MVQIKYFNDPFSRVPLIFEVETIGTWLTSNFNAVEDVSDLRFFRGDLLGEEIDRSDTSFLGFTDGVFTVVHDESLPRSPDLWLYAAISLIFAAATYLLTPRPKIPDVGRDQQSATNALSDPTNEPRVGGRTDDIFGTVNGHVPALWQVPYRIGVNNEEREIMYLCIGRGRYQYDENGIYDGDTLIKSIPNTACSIYGPYTSPLSGDSPEFQIGDDINEPIGIYDPSNELSATELLPPNDLDITEVTWEITGSGNVGTITATTFPEGWQADNYVKDGGNVFLNQMMYLSLSGSLTLYSPPPSGGSITYDSYNAVDLGAGVTHTVISVSKTTITISLDALPPDIYNIWQSLSNYSPPDVYVLLSDETVIDDLSAVGEELYFDPTYTQPAEPKLARLNNTVGNLFDNIVGPFAVKKGATQALLNLVSSNGFYKLISNNETEVVANVRVVVEELDSNGDVTGNSYSTDIEYHTNQESRTSQVFVTARIDVSVYEFAQIYAIRTTDRDKEGNVSNVDAIEWRDLTFFTPVDVTEFGDATTAHVVIPSNSTSRLNKERKFKIDLTRKVTQYFYGGTFGPVESYPTDQFDQILIHMALDPKIGRLALDDIDADGYMLTRDTIINYFGSDEMCRFGYAFDSDELTFQDMYSIVAEVVNCKPYVQNGVYDLFFERLQPVSTRQITVRNKIRGSESRKISFQNQGLYDGVELSYRDENTLVLETVFIPEDQSALNPNKVELTGCTTRLQAWRKAWRIYQKQIYGNEKVNFDLDDFGKLIVPGERVDVTDGTRFTQRGDETDGYRIYDGEVVEVNGLNVELSEPVKFTAGENHYIQFTMRNGDLSLPILCSATDDEYVVTLGSLPGEAIYDGYSADRTAFIFASEQLMSSTALIPETIDVKIENDVVQNQVSAINYSDLYYLKDLEVPNG